jgi:ubiquinone/menaquinone biosynthesis C-methylase UbiE
MNRMIIKHVFILMIISLNLLCCKSQVKPAKNLSMQNLRGYPLIENIDSIKQFLKHKCLNTINFKKGEIIADVGAGNGYLKGMLSLFNDSLTFYIQDIDTSICNQKTVDKVVDFYKRLKKKPFTNKFYVVNGSDVETTLPDETFDKILMIFTYPYLKYPQVFMTDIKHKLKPDGRMYIINPDVPINDLTKSLKAEYGWNESPIDKEINDIIGCGFELISKSKYSYTNKRGNPYIMVFKQKNPKI